MVKRITDRQGEDAWQMYEQGKSISRIAKFIHVSYSSTWSMTEGRKKGFKNYSEYLEHLAQQRSKNHANRELSDLIKSRLKELGKTQIWLAQQIGVTRQSVSLYSHGKIIPQNEVLNKLFTVLEVKRKPRSLDDLVEE